MLRKLLKYEFAATGRYLLPLLCLLLVMAAAAGLSIRILSHQSADYLPHMAVAAMHQYFYHTVLSLQDSKILHGFFQLHRIFLFHFRQRPS